jgi:hypothetical protein
MKHVTDAVMSGDGSRFAFTFGRGDMQYTMLDGKEYPAKGLVHFTRDNRAFVGYVSGGHACIEELK